MTTNDHTVPQMYLRRFAVKKPGNKHHSTVARHVDRLDKPFPVGVHKVASGKDFHLGVEHDGSTSHVTEQLMSHIEAHAAPVLNTVLDDHDEAFPRRWPLRHDERVRLAYYIAAQLLRTKRQRRRLNHLIATHTGSHEPGTGPEASGGLPLPERVLKASANNPHLAYIAHNLGVLAGLVYARPWGIGFSDACLLTSDTPAVIVGGHDAPDQLAAAAYWDVLLPLDPHRFLLLPGTSTTGPPERCVDRRLHIRGGMGTLLSQIVWDAADQQVYHHPDHCPFDHFTPDGNRLPAPDEPDSPGAPRREPEYYLGYEAVPRHMTIHRRWVTEHPPPQNPGPDAKDDDPASYEAILNRLSSIIDERREKAPPAARR